MNKKKEQNKEKKPGPMPFLDCAQHVWRVTYCLKEHEKLQFTEISTSFNYRIKKNADFNSSKSLRKVAAVTPV